MVLLLYFKTEKDFGARFAESDIYKFIQKYLSIKIRFEQI